jgi:hypothetical protein
MTTASDGTAWSVARPQFRADSVANTVQTRMESRTLRRTRRFSTGLSTATWQLNRYEDVVMNIRSTLETRAAR